MWSLSHYKRIPFSLSLGIPLTHTHRHTHSLSGINLCDYRRTARFEGDAGCPPLWDCGILRKPPLCSWSHLWCYHESLVHKLPLCSLPIKWHNVSYFLKIETFLLHPNKKPNNPKFQWNRLLEELHQVQISPLATCLDLGKSLALLNLPLLPHKWKIEIIGGLSLWSCCEAWMRSPGTALGKLHGTQEGLSEGLQQIHQWDVFNIWNQGLPQDCSNDFLQKHHCKGRHLACFCPGGEGVDGVLSTNAKKSPMQHAVDFHSQLSWFLISLHTWDMTLSSTSHSLTLS